MVTRAKNISWSSNPFMEKDCMKYEIFGILAVFFAIGMAGAVEPLELSGKDFSDIDMFNGTDILEQNEDLAGTSASMMGIDVGFLRNNPEDGKPINQSKPVLGLGSMTGYDRTAWHSNQAYYTPVELEMSKNKSTGLEIQP